LFREQTFALLPLLMLGRALEHSLVVELSWLLGYESVRVLVDYLEQS